MTKDEMFMEKYFFGEELSVEENHPLSETDCFSPPETYLSISPYSVALLEKVKAAFEKAGCEGEGDLGLLYVKPFKSDPVEKEKPENQIGFFMWRKTQANNGKSFIGFYPNSMQSVYKRSEVIYND
jgi:hypothetical protein